MSSSGAVQGVVCTDEFLLHPDPYASRQEWCAARLKYSETRLAECTLPTVLVSHFPLIRKPTEVLRHGEFALWCGTVHTASWPMRFRAKVVVYRHLHIPGTTFHDGVRFEEVSLGYPQEWKRQGGPRAGRAGRGRSFRQRAEMLEEILPPAVVAVDRFSDAPDAYLYPEEETRLAKAVTARRSEYRTARWCARMALGKLGLPPGPILTDTRGAPKWPAGIAGSITQCAGYRAAAVAPVSQVASIGIDAEPHAELPGKVLAIVSRHDEMPELARLAACAPDVCWDRLLFSAKEAVYKAWYPLTGQWLDFTDASMSFDPSCRAFTARISAPVPTLPGYDLTEFSGRWTLRDGLIVTAVIVPSACRSPARAGTTPMPSVR